MASLGDPITPLPPKAEAAGRARAPSTGVKVQTQLPFAPTPKAGRHRAGSTAEAMFSQLEHGEGAPELVVGNEGCGLTVAACVPCGDGSKRGGGGGSSSSNSSRKSKPLMSSPAPSTPLSLPTTTTPAPLCKGFTKEGKACQNSVNGVGSGYCRWHGSQAGVQGSEGAAAAAAEEEARVARASEKKAGEHRAAVLATHRKVPVFVKVRGVEDIRVLQSKLGELVRDRSLQHRRRELHSRLGEGAYYTRARALRGACVSGSASASASGGGGVEGDVEVGAGEHLLEVDHTLECQILAHAIVQTSAFSEGGWLGAVDLQASRTHQQSHVVCAGLEPLFRIQNCVEDASLFNLRLMDKSLNVTKGGVIRNWLEGRYAGGEASVLTGLRAGFRKSTAVRSGLISQEEGDDLAANLHAALARVEAPYLERLEAAKDMPHSFAASLGERRAHGERFQGLCDTLHSLIDELECIE